MEQASLSIGSPELWRLPRVLATVGMSKSEWYRQIRVGDAPVPIKNTEKMARWNSQAVRRYVDDKINSAVQRVSIGDGNADVMPAAPIKPVEAIATIQLIKMVIARTDSGWMLTSENLPGVIMCGPDLENLEQHVPGAIQQLPLLNHKIRARVMRAVEFAPGRRVAKAGAAR